MEQKRTTLEEKLKFIDDAKKTDIAKANIESIKIGRVNVHTIMAKKHYIFGIH